jgi:hypothetical protein
MVVELTPVQVVREAWGIFELEDGLRLWAKVVASYAQHGGAGPGSDQLRLSTVLVVQAESQFKGKPNPSPVDLRAVPPARVYESIRVIQPCESLYLVPPSTVLRVQLDPIRARRYSQFGPEGDPVVQLDNQIQVENPSLPRSPGPPAVPGPNPARIPSSEGV